MFKLVRIFRYVRTSYISTKDFFVSGKLILLTAIQKLSRKFLLSTEEAEIQGIYKMT